MDYQVAFYQDSWPIEGKASTADIVEQVINTRDAAMSQLRLPSSQEGKIDLVSCGIWLKVRTDRPREEGQLTTAFVSVKDKGLHRPVPFSFTREPLAETQIRLIELFPGARGEGLRAILHSVDLVSSPAFDALSYVWGNREVQDTIILGDDSFKRERISASVHAALTELRRPDTSRFIWVDALCIDQHNILERNHQVRIMGTIFASAAQVIIWLGEATEHSKSGIQTLQFIAEGKAFEENPPWKDNPPEVIQKGLTDILSRNWFRRIWTVQEAALSSRKTVMICSDGSFCEWSAAPHCVSLFIRGLKFAAVTADWTENGLAGSDDLGLTGVDLTGIIDLLGQQLQQSVRSKGLNRAGLEPDLLDIAYEVKGKQCVDPRDRLYGILGLAVIRGSDEYHQLQPDYSKTLQQVQDDFRQILLEAAKREPEAWVLAQQA
ncbi:hypothetical protein PV05_09118 [Exophiala xenobiotica]|uniref:Heterokaryon incompatibility domain-containing protein n=1 Tax=Exophiala xenobiotica TaxID=348802 RepID=A0A0D2EDX4_9EURO|nr:uncharacterized protein PV05_09118 [Exophiala xenobiotica]KIW53558.1 hypothetical protein PV05_09118 [Exophiala xenobiotica]